MLAYGGSMAFLLYVPGKPLHLFGFAIFSFVVPDVGGVDMVSVDRTGPRYATVFVAVGVCDKMDIVAIDGSGIVTARESPFFAAVRDEFPIFEDNGVIS